MKKFTKLFLSCAVVSAMAMSATAAFAELPTEVPITGQVTGTYTVAGASVAITNFVQTGDTLDDTKPATYLVVKGADTVAAAQENIAGIDQVDNASATLTGAKTGLGNGNVTEVTDGMTAQPYTVYVGYYNSTGAFKVSKGSFTLTDGSAPAANTIDLIIGDVDLNKAVNSFDQTRILRKLANLTTNTGRIGEEFVYADDNADYAKVAEATKYIVGDVDANAAVNSFDQTRILRKLANLTTNTGFIGQTIKVEAKEDNGSYTVGD